MADNVVIRINWSLCAYDTVIRLFCIILTYKILNKGMGNLIFLLKSIVFFFPWVLVSNTASLVKLSPFWS